MSEEKILWRDALVIRESEAGPSLSGDHLAGYAAVWGERTRSPVTDYGKPAYEVLAPGCFTESIKRNNVTLVFHHYDHAEYADTQSQTLSLSEDNKGLGFRAALPPYANTMRGKIVSGAMRGMSIGFVPQDVEIDSSGVVVVKRGDLKHISPVYTPAYGGTSLTISSGSHAKRELGYAARAKMLDLLSRF